MNPSEASSQAALGAKTDKGVCWSITINNPTAEDLQQWESLSGLHWVREVTGQIEKGENGTPHIQGCLKTQSVRFSQVKKALPRAHIEKARSQAALERYVVKEDTRLAALSKVKIATQAEVQTYCLAIALRYCYNWKQADPLDTNELDLLSSCRSQIKCHWETILDEAVETLIYQGYYGVEFVVSNPQIRTAFKKYLPAILYRTYNARNQAPPPPAQDHQTPPQDDAPGASPPDSQHSHEHGLSQGDLFSPSG